MQDTFKRGFGDRYDGWRVRHVDAVYNVIPFVMRSRLDAQNFFEENIPIENIEHFIREHREDMPDLAFMHVIIAAMVRMIATRPYLNRFVMWNKIYARNHIDIALMIKRRQSNVETNVKPEFEPSATLTDVMNIMNAIVNENIDDDANNSMDKLADILGYIPAFILRFVIGGLRWLDNIGLMPKGVRRQPLPLQRVLDQRRLRWHRAHLPSPLRIQHLLHIRRHGKQVQIRRHIKGGGAGGKALRRAKVRNR